MRYLALQTLEEMDIDYNAKAISVFQNSRLNKNMKIIENLAFVFAKITVRELFKMSDSVLQDYLSRARLNLFERHDAVQAVLQARKRQYDWAGKRIEKKSKLSQEDDTSRKLPPRIRLLSPPRTPVQPRERGNNQVREEYMVILQPTQPTASDTPRQPSINYSKDLYAILNLTEKKDLKDKSIAREIEDQYLFLTGARYPFATKNMKVHTAARILHWQNSRMLYGLKGDAVMWFILKRIPIVKQFVVAPLLPNYMKAYTADEDITENAKQNGWNLSRGFRGS